MEELGSLAVSLGTAWLSLVIVLIVLPSALGVSLGISEAYMWVLVKTLEVGGPHVLRCPGAALRGRGRGAAVAGWVRPVPVAVPWVPPRFVPFFSDSSRVCLPWIRFKAFRASERA